MALRTRENSKIEILIDKKGNMGLLVAGIQVPTYAITVDGTDFRKRGKTIVEIPTYLVTFVNYEEAEKEVDAN